MCKFIPFSLWIFIIRMRIIYMNSMYVDKKSMKQFNYLFYIFTIYILNTLTVIVNLHEKCNLHKMCYGK